MAEARMLKGLFAVSSHATFSAKAGFLRAAACLPCVLPTNLWGCNNVTSALFVTWNEILATFASLQKFQRVYRTTNSFSCFGWHLNSLLSELKQDVDN